MQEIYCENIKKLMQNKNKLEKQLSIKITNQGKNVFVSGQPENEYIALKVIEAIDLGFSVERALLLKNEDVCLQILSIKNITKKKNLEEIRARIIGTHGRTLKTLCNLSNCFIELYDNQIGIIGNTEDIEDAVQGITCLIQGSKQGNVYGKLERARKRRKVQSKIPIKEKRPREDSNLRPYG